MKKLLATTALATFLAVAAPGAQAADGAAPTGYPQTAAPTMPNAQPMPMPIYGPYGPFAAPTQAADAETLAEAQARTTRQIEEYGKKMQEYGRQLQAEAQERMTERWSRSQDAWRNRLDALRALWEAEQEMREASLRDRFGPVEPAEQDARLNAFKAAAEKQRQAMQTLADANRATADAFAPITRQDMETMRQFHTRRSFDRRRDMDTMAGQRRDWAKQRADAMQQWHQQRRFTPPFGYAAPYGQPPAPGQPAPQDAPKPTPTYQ